MKKKTKRVVVGFTEATTKRKANEYLKRYGRKKDNNRRAY
jgi:hypothetical protein